MPNKSGRRSKVGLQQANVAVELSNIGPQTLKVLLSCSDVEQHGDIRRLVARWFGDFPALGLLSCQMSDRLPAAPQAEVVDRLHLGGVCACVGLSTELSSNLCVLVSNEDLNF